jgi:hypothetical protein
MRVAVEEGRTVATTTEPSGHHGSPAVVQLVRVSLPPPGLRCLAGPPARSPRLRQRSRMAWRYLPFHYRHSGGTGGRVFRQMTGRATVSLAGPGS